MSYALTFVSGVVIGALGLKLYLHWYFGDL